MAVSLAAMKLLSLRETQLPGTRSQKVVTLLSWVRAFPSSGTVPVIVPRLTEVKVTSGLVNDEVSTPLELKSTGNRFGSLTASIFQFTVAAPEKSLATTSTKAISWSVGSCSAIRLRLSRSSLKSESTTVSRLTWATSSPKK